MHAANFLDSVVGKGASVCVVPSRHFPFAWLFSVVLPLCTLVCRCSHCTLVVAWPLLCLCAMQAVEVPEELPDKSAAETAQEHIRFLCSVRTVRPMGLQCTGQVIVVGRTMCPMLQSGQHSMPVGQAICVLIVHRGRHVWSLARFLVARCLVVCCVCAGCLDPGRLDVGLLIAGFQVHAVCAHIEFAPHAHRYTFVGGDGAWHVAWCWHVF